MAAPLFIENVNKLLEPVLFQVVGSTPESLRDSLKKVNVEANAVLGYKIAAGAIFAAAVNKATLETFLARPEFQDTRATIGNSLSLNGKINMTSMTLLGHCILTTSFANDVEFAKALREKMGQPNIWEGSLDSGSLSDMQRKILKEKKQTCKALSARLLGSAFLKITEVDRQPLTADERAFWYGNNEKPISNPRTETTPRRPATSAQAAPKTPASRQRPSPSVSPESDDGTEFILLPDGSSVEVPRDLLEYYRTFTSNDPQRLADSIARRGVNEWIGLMTDAKNKDPEGKAYRAASTTRG